MSFTPRTTIPDPYSQEYDAWNRYGWLLVYPQGNCTGYAYGRMNECAGQSLYNDFYCTQPPRNARDWIYNTWPDQTFTSGAIDIHLGDVLVYGAGTYGHVEVVEKISADGTKLTTSYSIYSSSYSTAQRFATRVIDYPTWTSELGTWIDNSGNSHTYTNPFIGYIHNKYITEDAFKLAALAYRLKRRRKGIVFRR
jgi:surface antigen